MNSSNIKFKSLSPKKKLIASKAISGDTYTDSLPLCNTTEIYFEKMLFPPLALVTMHNSSTELMLYGQVKPLWDTLKVFFVSFVFLHQFFHFIFFSAVLLLFVHSLSLLFPSSQEDQLLCRAFCGFRRFLRPYARTAEQIMPLRLPSPPLPIHYSLINL